MGPGRFEGKSKHREVCGLSQPCWRALREWSALQGLLVRQRHVCDWQERGYLTAGLAGCKRGIRLPELEIYRDQNGVYRHCSVGLPVQIRKCIAIVIEDNLQPFTYTSDPAYSWHLLSETGSSVSQDDFQLLTSCFFLSAEITNLSPHPQILFMMDVQALYFFPHL